MAAEDELCHPRRFRRRKVDNARLRWLSPKEAEALIEAADARVRVMIMFLLGTGCRTGEMLKLSRDDLFLDTGEAWIAETKSGRPRMVQIVERTRSMLAASNPSNDGAVFRTPKGRPYHVEANRGGQIEAAFSKARDAAKLGRDVTPHVLRHTWATWYYSQTRDFGGLMDLGGWAKADMANRYRKIAPASTAADLRKYGWDFGGTPAADNHQRRDVLMPRGV